VEGGQQGSPQGSSCSLFSADAAAGVVVQAAEAVASSERSPSPIAEASKRDEGACAGGRQRLMWLCMLSDAEQFNWCSLWTTNAPVAVRE
jgi:hypothetical protein